MLAAKVRELDGMIKMPQNMGAAGFATRFPRRAWRQRNLLSSFYTGRRSCWLV